MSYVNFLRVGPWMWCYHCRVILPAVGPGHYCGAPWQKRAADIPSEWMPPPAFTREDVELLRGFRSGYWETGTEDMARSEEADFEGLADRIESLLPPEKEGA